MKQVILGKSTTQATLVKHSFSRANIQQKVRLLYAVLLFSPLSSLLAQNFLENDFRDYNATYNFQASLDAKSNELFFNTFDKKWNTLPSHSKENKAFGELSLSAFISFDAWRVGAFNQKLAQIGINDGFIETWYAADKDFFTLLGMSDINQELRPSPISGSGVYISSSGLFLQKMITLNSKHHISMKTKLHVSDDLQSIKIKGKSDSEGFKGSLDYCYAQENLVSKRPDRDDSKGLGYSVDIEYIYDNDTFYIYLGVFNLHSFIYYQDVTLMHYDFDSQIVYEGEDGYKHSKPFGVGYYKDNISLKQKIPQYYKGSINYQHSSKISIGNNVNIYDQLFYNEPYLNVKLGDGRYKLGYVLESKEFVFASYFENMSFSVSNRFGSDNNLLVAGFRLKY